MMLERELQFSGEILSFKFGLSKELSSDTLFDSGLLLWSNSKNDLKIFVSLTTYRWLISISNSSQFIVSAIPNLRLNFSTKSLK
jgi:hypothetical protein